MSNAKRITLSGMSLILASYLDTMTTTNLPILCHAFLTPTPKPPPTHLSSLPEWREHSPQSIPILPFPYSDILLQGQTTQLNLYEERFHKLFEDVVTNHHSVVGMGLLAGPGMITTLPLCEVESYTRLGREDAWVDRGDGMGNGSIFVTIRVVGRGKIGELIQEEPYIKARVVEVCDGLEGEEGLEVASGVAGSIETLILSIANMEHAWNEMKGAVMETEGGSESETMVEMKSDNDVESDSMNRRILNAQLEALIMQDTVEGVVLNDDLETDTLDDDEDDEFIGDDETSDRRSRFHNAFLSAKESETQGYITRTVPSNSESNNPQNIRTLQDLNAISWAAFCTGESNDNDDMQLNVYKIQALDTTNVLHRLRLGAAMLRIEKKRWQAKLALARMEKSGSEEES